MRPRIPPALVVLAAALAMWGVDRLLPLPAERPPGAGPLALALAACGLAAGALGVARFRRAGTSFDPLTPAKATTLVTSGIYRRTRNPMYLGLALLLVAWGVWLSTLPGLMVVPLFVLYMNRFQIGPEERALESIFGAEYDAYRRRVRRWL